MPDLKHPLTARFTNALALAANIHRLQARRGTQVPDMAHILGVASIALEHAANEDEAIAAVLHDAIEDAPKRLGASGIRGAIGERFGADVLKIVGVTPTPTFNRSRPGDGRKSSTSAELRMRMCPPCSRYRRRHL